MSSKNEVECSLREAIINCKHQGGVFWMKNHDAPYRYSVDVFNNKIEDENGNPFKLEPEDFDYVWIYEPAKKTAFQEWRYEYEKIENGKIIRVDPTLKDCWNACADAAFKIDFHGNLAPAQVEYVRMKLLGLKES